VGWLIDTNIVRHAGATRADLEMHVDGGLLILTIADNGRGFDIAAIRDGNGLSNMRDRARLMGGGLDVSSRSGAGTIVRLTVPVKATVTERNRRLRRSSQGTSPRRRRKPIYTDGERRRPWQRLQVRLLPEVHRHHPVGNAEGASQAHRLAVLPTGTRPLSARCTRSTVCGRTGEGSGEGLELLRRLTPKDL
jgi:hypothetical protein